MGGKPLPAHRAAVLHLHGVEALPAGHQKGQADRDSPQQRLPVGPHGGIETGVDHGIRR
ncbi:hypothetical protein D3C73_1335620 [compost metagenome]